MQHYERSNFAARKMKSNSTQGVMLRTEVRNTSKPLCPFRVRARNCQHICLPAQRSTAGRGVRQLSTAVFFPRECILPSDAGAVGHLPTPPCDDFRKDESVLDKSAGCCGRMQFPAGHHLWILVLRKEKFWIDGGHSFTFPNWQLPNGLTHSFAFNWTYVRTLVLRNSAAVPNPEQFFFFFFKSNPPRLIFIPLVSDYKVASPTGCKGYQLRTLCLRFIRQSARPCLAQVSDRNRPLR